MNLSMPDALVILGIIGTIIVAMLKVAPAMKPKDCGTCSEHSGVEATIKALTTTLERLQDTMQQVQQLLVQLASERQNHESGRTPGAAQ